MQDYSSANIRNVLLAGHGGVGKTTLGEALLHASGATTRVGSVEDGTTVLDFDVEEKERCTSVSLSIAPVEWRGTKINLLDSPGYADFIGDVQAGLSVCDIVCLVVSAVDGVEVQHEVIWRLAADLGLPRIIFINKVDRERASVESTIEQLQEAFGPTVAPIHMPIGSESTFSGIVALLYDEAFVYKGGKASATSVPPEVADAAQEMRTAAIEAIVETDEDLLERYFGDETIEVTELLETFGKGILAGEAFPVLIGSATRQIGVDRLADFLVAAGPSPLERPGMDLADGERIADGVSGSPAAYVFNTYADRFVGQISYLRVARGELTPDIHLTNARSGANERLHQLFVVSGESTAVVDKLAYGDLGAVPKLSDTATGDTLADKADQIAVVVPALLDPVYSRAVVAKNRGEEDKLANALHRIGSEDTTLRITRDAATHQTLISGMGEGQLRVASSRMQRKFGVEVEMLEPRVAYRETARASSDFEGKHKKQSGGRGQFGVAHIELEPLPRGTGYEFVDAVVGGSIPRNFIAAVDKGIQQAMEKGPIAGYPVVDVRLTVNDGKHHLVDSDEFSFKMAGSHALRGALQAAKPVLLEPIGQVDVLIPDDLAGDVSGDLNSRRGRLQGIESVPGGRQLIRASVPMAEMTRYAIDLRSITGGRGTFSIEFDHYDEVPAHLQARIIEAPAEND